MRPLPAAPGCDCHVCRPDESYDEQDRRVIDTVLKHGWQVMMVAEGAGCDDPGHQDHPETRSKTFLQECPWPSRR